MRLLPRSLAGRLLVTAGVALAAALAFAALAIGHVLEGFVTEGLDARLDAQIAVVARAVRADGSLDRQAAIDVPPFDRSGSGWEWQVTAPGGVLRSASLASGALTVRLPPPPPWHRDPRRPRPFEATGADGHRLHGRLLRVPTAAVPATILAAGPRSVVERPLRAARVPLAASLLLLGGALMLAVLVQLRLALRPLKRLGAMLSEVRGGARRRIDVDEPTELLPLVAEMNALIDANEAALARARAHAANLAHGLKTPLATLRLDLAEPGSDPDGRLAVQVARMEAQVRHHLGRARAADPTNAAALAVPLAPHIAELTDALARIHAGRGVTPRIAIAEGLAVRCDPQDLDELLGNILDNAWRHAAARVSIRAEATGRVARVTIADDGAGLPPDRLARLAIGNARADEQAEGHGQGIRIARELAELHGGTLALRAAAGGGLEVVIELERAAPGVRARPA